MRAGTQAWLQSLVTYPGPTLLGLPFTISLLNQWYLHCCTAKLTNKSFINAVQTVMVSSMSQKHRSDFQRTVKLNRYFKMQQSTVPSQYSQNLRSALQGIQTMIYSSQLFATNTGNWRNCLGRAGLPWTSAPSHTEWLHQGWKICQPISLVLNGAIIHAVIWSPLLYHHSCNNQNAVTAVDWKSPLEILYVTELEMEAYDKLKKRSWGLLFLTAFN